MSWVDLVVIALALVAAVSGWRHGMAVALLSFVGVLGGAIIGVRVAPLLAQGINNTSTRVIVSVAVVVLLVVLGETTGVFLGRRVRDRITGERTLAIDSTLGSILQALAVVVAAWLVALPLASASLPAIASGVRGSEVLRAVDSVMPTAAKQLPADLRQLLDNSGFPDVLSPFAQTPVTAIGPPDSALLQSPAVAAVQPSVLKIRGRAAVLPAAVGRVGLRLRPGAGDDQRPRRRRHRCHRGRGHPARPHLGAERTRRLLRPEGRRRGAARARAHGQAADVRARPFEIRRRCDRAGLPHGRPVQDHARPDPPGDQPEGAGHLRQRRGQRATSTPCGPPCAPATPAVR